MLIVGIKFGTGNSLRTIAFRKFALAQKRPKILLGSFVVMLGRFCVETFFRSRSSIENLLSFGYLMNGDTECAAFHNDE